MSDAVLTRLRSPQTIRARCERILAAVEGGDSPHFRVDAARLDAAADLVADVTRSRYPRLDVPYHSRWRHFEAGGVDRHSPLRARLAARAGAAPDHVHPFPVTRSLVDLAVVSVLLDAGAGAAWRYRPPSGAGGTPIGRSEGLAIASLDAFEAGVFSSDPADPWRVDASALRALDEGTLARVFQVGADNPLVGLAGRTRLMNALGDALATNPRWFGADGRPGGLVDAVICRDPAPSVDAAGILDALLQGLGAIWPSGQQLHGVALGDCWRHPHATPPDHPDDDAGWVPFHKLSQWLTYSLLEPFEWAGVSVSGLAQLTGLPEYRNGGLLIDTGVLVLRNPSVVEATHPVGSGLIVEWRALTVALIDRLAERVRLRLDPAGRVGGQELPLAAILEGGTWAAGRELARRLRGGEPPLSIASDGTVF